jgi:hypothetical protein
MILLSSIIQTFEDEFLALYQNSMLPSHRKALAAMKQCRTTQSPVMLAQCDDCDSQSFMPHSCGHRNCTCSIFWTFREAFFEFYFNPINLS